MYYYKRGGGGGVEGGVVFTDINAINIFKCSFPNDMLFLSLYGPK